MSAAEVAQAAAQAAQPVKIEGLFGTGITLGNLLIGLLNVICGGALVAFVKTRPKILELVNARRKDDLDTMGERIASLETSLGKLTEAREADRARHDAEVAILRHGLNGAEACLDAILLLIEAAPEKAIEHAKKVRQMRDESRERVEREKRAFAAAKVIAAGGQVPPDDLAAITTP